MKKRTTYSKPTAIPERASFAGIDYHKKFAVIALGDENGSVLGIFKIFNNDENNVRGFFSRFPGLQCAIENCRGKEWFVEILKESGCMVSISNTYAVKLIAESRCKTDKIDARILMELLAKGFLPTVYQPTAEETALREQLRWRTALMRSRTQYKNRAHALMDKENKGAKVGSTKSRTKIFEKQPLSQHRQEILDGQLEVIEFFEELVRAEDKRFEHLANTNADTIRLQTIPGFGPLSSVAYFAEIGDVSRFKNARKVSGYLGLASRLYSSSDTRRLGPITKQGSGHMRWLLVQSAWMSLRTSPYFLQRFNQIKARRGKGPAIVAIARMLCEIAYRILRDKTTYDESRLWAAIAS